MPTAQNAMSEISARLDESVVPNNARAMVRACQLTRQYRRSELRQRRLETQRKIDAAKAEAEAAAAVESAPTKTPDFEGILAWLINSAPPSVQLASLLVFLVFLPFIITWIFAQVLFGVFGSQGAVPSKQQNGTVGTTSEDGDTKNADLHANVKSVELLNSSQLWEVYNIIFEKDSITADELITDPTQIPDQVILRLRRPGQAHFVTSASMDTSAAIERFLSNEACGSTVGLRSVLYWEEASDNNESEVPEMPATAEELPAAPKHTASTPDEPAIEVDLANPESVGSETDELVNTEVPLVHGSSEQDHDLARPSSDSPSLLARSAPHEVPAIIQPVLVEQEPAGNAENEHQAPLEGTEKMSDDVLEPSAADLGDLGDTILDDPIAVPAIKTADLNDIPVAEQAEALQTEAEVEILTEAAADETTATEDSTSIETPPVPLPEHVLLTQEPPFEEVISSSQLEEEPADPARWIGIYRYQAMKMDPVTLKPVSIREWTYDENNDETTFDGPVRPVDPATVPVFRTYTAKMTHGEPVFVENYQPNAVLKFCTHETGNAARRGNFYRDALDTLFFEFPPTGQYIYGDETVYEEMMNGDAERGMMEQIELAQQEEDRQQREDEVRAATVNIDMDDMISNLVAGQPDATGSAIQAVDADAAVGIPSGSASLTFKTSEEISAGEINDNVFMKAPSSDPSPASAASPTQDSSPHTHEGEGGEDEQATETAPTTIPATAAQAEVSPLVDWLKPDPTPSLFPASSAGLFTFGSSTSGEASLFKLNNEPVAAQPSSSFVFNSGSAAAGDEVPEVGSPAAPVVASEPAAPSSVDEVEESAQDQPADSVVQPLKDADQASPDQTTQIGDETLPLAAVSSSSAASQDAGDQDVSRQDIQANVESKDQISGIDAAAPSTTAPIATVTTSPSQEPAAAIVEQITPVVPPPGPSAANDFNFDFDFDMASASAGNTAGFLDFATQSPLHGNVDFGSMNFDDLPPFSPRDMAEFLNMGTIDADPAVETGQTGEASGPVAGTEPVVPQSTTDAEQSAADEVAKLEAGENPVSEANEAVAPRQTSDVLTSSAQPPAATNGQGESEDKTSGASVAGPASSFDFNTPPPTLSKSRVAFRFEATTASTDEPTQGTPSPQPAPPANPQTQAPPRRKIAACRPRRSAVARSLFPSQPTLPLPAPPASLEQSPALNAAPIPPPQLPGPAPPALFRNAPAQRAREVEDRQDNGQKSKTPEPKNAKAKANQTEQSQSATPTSASKNAKRNERSRRNRKNKKTRKNAKAEAEGDSEDDDVEGDFVAESDVEDNAQTPDAGVAEPEAEATIQANASNNDAEIDANAEIEKGDDAAPKAEVNDQADNNAGPQEDDKDEDDGMMDAFEESADANWGKGWEKTSAVNANSNAGAEDMAEDDAADDDDEAESSSPAELRLFPRNAPREVPFAPDLFSGTPFQRAELSMVEEEEANVPGTPAQDNPSTPEGTQQRMEWRRSPDPDVNSPSMHFTAPLDVTPSPPNLPASVVASPSTPARDDPSSPEGTPQRAEYRRSPDPNDWSPSMETIPRVVVTPPQANPPASVVPSPDLSPNSLFDSPGTAAPASPDNSPAPTVSPPVQVTPAPQRTAEPPRRLGPSVVGLQAQDQGRVYYRDDLDKVDLGLSSDSDDEL